jgi:hypothetical protein
MSRIDGPLPISNNNSTMSENNSVMTYKLQTGVEFLNNSVSMNLLLINYTWDNISANFQNQNFSYAWFDGNNYPIIIQSGLYTISELNEYFEAEQFKNGHYILDQSNTPVYYLNFQVTRPYNAVVITCSLIPSSLPLNHSNPASMVFPASPITAQIVFPAFIKSGKFEYGFGKILGFSPNIYPLSPASTTYQVLSDTIVNAHPVNSVVVKCNLVNSGRYSSDRQVLKNFTPNSTIGSQLRIESYNNIYFRIIDGMYTEVVLSFFDNQGRPLVIKDPNILIELIIAEQVPIRHYKRDSDKY